MRANLAQIVPPVRFRIRVSLTSGLSQYSRTRGNWDAPIGADRTPWILDFNGCIEPVFWTGGAEQSGPADDFVQAEAPYCAQ